MSEDPGPETGRVLLWIGLGVLVVLLLGTPFGWWWGAGSGWDAFWGFLGFMMFFPILLIVLIVVLIVAIAGGSRRPPAPVAAQPPEPARSSKESLDILQKRYAKGELTRAEYLRMKDDLS